MKARSTHTIGKTQGNIVEMRVIQFSGHEIQRISWRELPTVLVFGNPQTFYFTPISHLIGDDLAPRVGGYHLMPRW